MRVNDNDLYGLVNKSEIDPHDSSDKEFNIRMFLGSQ